jgi:hypothetical protein
MRRITLSFVTYLAVLYVSTLSNKQHGFAKKKKSRMKSKFCFSQQLLSEKFLAVRRIQRNIIINVQGLYK